MGCSSSPLSPVGAWSSQGVCALVPSLQDVPLPSRTDEGEMGAGQPFLGRFGGERVTGLTYADLRSSN